MLKLFSDVRNSLRMGAIGRFLTRHHRGLFVFGCVMLGFSACMFVTGCGVPSFLTDLETIIPIAGSAIAGILAIIGGLTGNPELDVAAAAINAIVNKVDAELAEINTLITNYKANPSDTALQNIESAIQSVVTDLGNILTIGGLPANTALVIQGVVQAVLTQLNALLTVIPVFKGSTAGQSLAIVKPVKAADFKAQIHAALAAKAP